MIEAECPHCRAVIVIEDSYAGEIVSCACCGRPFEMPERGDAGAIIEVHTEEVGAVREDEGGVEVSAPERPAGGERRWHTAYAFEIERRYGGDPGCCCGVGCLLLALLAGLSLLRGLLSLF